MSAIGSENFIAIRGEIDVLGETLELITRPAEDGVAFRKMGKHSRPFRLVTFADVDTGGTPVKTKIAAYKALVGTLVTITDDLGEAHTNIMIRDVRPVSARNVVGTVGGLTAGDYLIVCQWLCQATEVPV